MEIGRNEKCPCGSGLKYKKCCLNKRDDSNFSDLNNIHRNYKWLKKQSKIKQCLHPNDQECSEKIIAAHSIQNNKILKSIADNGCLYMPSHKSDNPFLPMTKWGRREATVFTGFCGYHDNELFKSIENYDFNKTAEHVFLYIYRCFAIEYHRKQEAIKMQQLVYNKKPSLIRNQPDDPFIGVKLSLSDLSVCKEKFDESIKNKKYDILQYIIWEFDEKINFAASGFEVVCTDLKGNKIQDILDTAIHAKHLFYSVFPEGTKSYCILAWIKEEDDIFSEYYNQLIDLEYEQQKKFINNLLPRTTENIVINPTAWDKLDSNKKDEFGMLFWGLADLYEISTNESFAMLSHTTFDLFTL